MSSVASLAPERTRRLQRRVRLIVATVIGYNVIEALVALIAGTEASSTALISFGLDSAVEAFSAAAIAWQFSAKDPEEREKVALRAVAIAFFVLTAYVVVQSIRQLLGSSDAEHSTPGIILTAVSLVVMPLLSWAERRTGRQLGSRSVVADSKQTLVCTYLSAAVLAGLIVNSTLGWSWADPIAALVVAGVALKEGIEAWRGDACASPPLGFEDAAHCEGGSDESPA